MCSYYVVGYEMIGDVENNNLINVDGTVLPAVDGLRLKPLMDDQLCYNHDHTETIWDNKVLRNQWKVRSGESMYAGKVSDG